MGYNTDFEGRFEFSRPLTVVEARLLHDFSESRHGGNMEVHEGYPGFWCDWAPTSDGVGLAWNGSEKFYNYIDWLEHLVSKFFDPWDIKLNGTVTWHGEGPGDVGRIIVEDNRITTQRGRVFSVYC